MTRLAWIAVLAMLVLAGCRTAPIVDISRAPLVQSPGTVLTMEDVAAAITKAGRKLGWRIEPVKPGELIGTLEVRRHVAVVTILHDTTTFTINYRDSANLHRSGDTIHRNYNHWVENLARGIRSEIALLAAAR